MERQFAISILAAALLAGCQSHAPAERARLEIGGTHMGDESAVALARSDNPTCKPGALQGMKDCNTWNYMGKLAGVPVEILQLEMANDHVQAMSGSFKAPGDELLAAVKRRYGEPKGDPSDHVWAVGSGDEILIMPAAGAWSLFAQSKKDQWDSNPRLSLPTPDIKGVKLGETTSEIMRRFPSATCKGDPSGYDICTQKGLTFGASHAATFIAYFRDGKALLLTMHDLDPADHDDLIRAMTAKFGLPDTEEQRPENAGKSETTWSLPYNRRVAAYGTDADIGPTVMLIDVTALGEATREKARESANSL